MNYYNEFDPHAAAWLRELIKMGAIPNGEVDERSITEVKSGDLKGYVQCHFFCGIAGWPEALRRAGVAADRPLWTGSCPCQSFSCAGPGTGVEDPRDLWPHFFRLIRECRPQRVFGEQVADAIGHGWLDRLSADLEAQDYAVGAAVLGAHSAGADHQRQRLYWLAQSNGIGRGRRSHGHSLGDAEQGMPKAEVKGPVVADWPAKSENDGLRRQGRKECDDQRSGPSCAPIGAGLLDGVEQCGTTLGLADAELRRPEQRDTGQRAVSELDAGGTDGFMGNAEGDDQRRKRQSGQVGRRKGKTGRSGAGRSGLVFAGEPGLQGLNGDVGNRDEPGRLGAEPPGSVAAASRACFWSRAVAIPCRDGKSRRFEPGIFPLVNGILRGVGYSGDPRLPEYVNATAEARVMRLKGYGNAINVETACMFIRAAEDVLQ